MRVFRGTNGHTKVGTMNEGNAMRDEDSGSRNLFSKGHSTTRDALGRPLAGFLAALLVLATLGAPLPAGANAAIIVTRVSQAAGGGDANGPSSEASISADGSRVVFASRASDIVAGDTGGKSDVFLYDSGSGTTTRVSVHSNGTAGNDHSGTPVISADGSTIAYSSTATNLVDGDLNGRRDVFVYDVASKQTTRISVATGGAEGDDDSANPSISDDGHKIAFSSDATNLVVGDTNGVGDVFLHENGVTTRVSVATSGSQASDNSGGPGISGDGTTIAFYSFADDLVADDTRGAADIFVREAGVTSRVSIANDGSEANRLSGRPSVSEDGNLVAYTSAASNLVEGDTNGSIDVFVYDRTAGVTTLVSRADNSSQSGNGPSGGPALSSVSSSQQASGGPAISADGAAITYSSAATNLIPSDTNLLIDVFVFDMASATTVRISSNADGTEGDGDSLAPALTADGEIIAFSSSADNLVTGDSNGVSDVFTSQVVNRPPVLNDSSATVAEKSPIGTQVATLAGIDPDGDPITYAITAGNGVGKFAVGASSGVLTTAGALNFEAKPQYVLTVEISDGELVDRAFITIDVLDVNEAPTGTGFTVTVAEDVATGTVLGTVTGTDPENDTLSYSIGGGDPNGQFAIHSASGKLSVATILDYETQKTHTLTIDVSDGSLVDEVTVTVKVTDVEGPSDPGTPPLFNPFDDDDGSIFEDDIEWLFLSGITAGCGVRLFCPKLPVTRGQMAAFLSRAFSLPATSTDYFTDDDTSIFEDDINKLAESGITKGCGPTSFCPSSNITRGQMAAFLVRAFEYTDNGGGDIFDDDDLSIFEDDIDKLATAGVTLGCNPPANTNYCPANPVTREQMAAFLRRALE